MKIETIKTSVRDVPILVDDNGFKFVHEMDWMAFYSEPGFEEERKSRQIEIADHEFFKQGMISAKKQGLI